jgi:hypothetical protein
MIWRAAVLVGPLALAASLASFAIVAACGDSSSDDAPATDGGTTVETGVSAADAGSDVDNGAPSTVFPAPHPVLPELVNGAKGPVLTAPKVMFVFYPGDTRETDLASFATKFAASTFWSTTTSEYGVGALTYGGMIELTGETAPTTISDAQLQAKVADYLANGTLGVPDPQTIYTFIFPSGTTITQTNPISTLLGPVLSCQAFTGYHDNVGVAFDDAGAPDDAGTKTDFTYAVIPTCAAGASTLTSVLSHEWVEAATDPELTANGIFSVNGGPHAAFYAPDTDHSVWSLLGGGEAADLCEPSGPTIEFTPPEIGFPVQRTWSNVAARASHDPCVPHVAGSAYFAAAPVLPDTVSFTTSFTGNITTKGTVIPVGGSKTIEVDLFSDGALDTPMTVKAQDLLYTYYGSTGLFKKTLSFVWDRTTGVNGEKLHLTVTVTDSSFLGGGHAFMITAVHGDRYQVWPGLIVEQ